MASRYEVEVTVAGAKDLKNVNWKNGSLHPYVVLWFDPANKCSTKVDVINDDDDPVWDEKLTIPLPPHILIEEAILSIDVVHANAEEGVKPLVGFARLPLQEVVEEVGIGEHTMRTVKLKRPSGRPHGKIDLHVLVRLYAPLPYPIPYGSNRQYGYGSVPPPSGYSYGAPPQMSSYSYGYDVAPQSGYPYAPQQEKKGNMGMGAGLAIGAVAGVVGGVAIAQGLDNLEEEMAEDAAEKVEDDNGYEDDF